MMFRLLLSGPREGTRPITQIIYRILEAKNRQKVEEVLPGGQKVISLPKSDESHTQRISSKCSSSKPHHWLAIVSLPVQSVELVPSQG
jgi:hypothetical protein